MKKPKNNLNIEISIIVPVHNSEKTLCRCVNSLIKQTSKLCEIILIDDHSSDSSEKICKQYCRKHNNIIYRHSNDYGVSAARNLGLSICSGDIVGFCDSDDFYEIDTIDNIKNVFTANLLVSCVMVGYNRVSFDGSLCSTHVYTNSFDFDFSELFERTVCDTTTLGSVCNKFYKVDRIKDIRFSPGLKLCEDTHFNCKIFSKNRNLRCHVINKSLYNYVQNFKSATSNNTNLYDSCNQLEYVNSLNKIIEDCYLLPREISAINHAIFKLSTIHYFSTAYTRDQQLVLRNNIKHKFFDFMRFMFKYDGRLNIKVLLAYYLILLGYKLIK